MPQGKLKVKAKLPASVLAKKKAQKGPSVTKRANKPQKAKVSAVQKLKNETIKKINQSTEDEIRNKALDGKVNLGKKKRPAPTDNDDASTSEQPSKKRKK